MREYITLPEAEIAPTSASRTPVDRPVAVVEAVNTASPVLWHVHVDHLHRPIRMTDAAKASVWDAQWLPWGGVHAITGSATLDARFPGQWFQSETGLHYNWHRSYDATVGRYTQPDPLGFVDGPSVYGYARGGPQSLVDPDGQLVWLPILVGGSLLLELAADQVEKNCKCGDGSGWLNWAAATGAGVAIWDHWVDPLRKPSATLGGSNVRSRITKVLDRLLPYGRFPAPTIRNPRAMSSLGASVSRFSPGR